MKNKKYISISIATFLLIMIDQIIKQVARKGKINFENGNNITLIIFLIYAIIMIVGMIIFIKRKKENINILLLISTSNLFASVISNMLDIIVKQSVTDYILINNINMNLSDVYMTIGWTLFIINLILEKRKSKI